jgi:hypothetical protein
VVLRFVKAKELFTAETAKNAEKTIFFFSMHFSALPACSAVSGFKGRKSQKLFSALPACSAVSGFKGRKSQKHFSALPACSAVKGFCFMIPEN